MRCSRCRDRITAVARGLGASEVVVDVEDDLVGVDLDPQRLDALRAALAEEGYAVERTQPVGTGA